MDASGDHQELLAAIETTLEPLIHEIMGSHGLAGLAIAIVRDHALLYAKGFGVRNVDTREPVTPESLFHLASVSKPFVATAIMQLVEQGKVALDAPVVGYLPYFRLDDARSSEITVQQMLSHTSGMPDVIDYHWYAPEADEGALERFVRSLAEMRLLHAPGEKYKYSNATFEVLGDVVAKVSGETFEGYIKEHILQPLQMHNSTFLRQEVRADLAMTPHFGMPVVTLEGVYPYHRAHAPSSTLHSSVVEMSHWAIANMNRGEFRGQRLLQPESYEQLWHRFAEIGGSTWEEAAGLSWLFGTYGSEQTIYHGGSDPGFGTEFVMVPARGDAVHVAANSNTAGIAAVTDAALDLVLGVKSDAFKASIAVPVAAVLRSQGRDAAIAEYQRLYATAAERYDFRPARFMDTCWGAIEARGLHLPGGEHIKDLLQVWLAVQPDAAEAHEMVGWVHSIEGDEQRARHHLQRAVELDPGADHAAALLEQL
jgi:CubicO group peptidase (beta-lactamase class C family)